MLWIEKASWVHPIPSITDKMGLTLELVQTEISSFFLFFYIQIQKLKAMKNTAFLSLTQFASENGGFVKVSPVAESSKFPAGVLYQRHLQDGTVQNVRGITFLTKKGVAVDVALSNDLNSKSLKEIMSNWQSAGIAKTSYEVIDEDGTVSLRDRYILYSSKSRFDEAAALDCSFLA